MLKKITKKHDIFKSNNFVKDEIAFNLMLYQMQSASIEAKLFSDEEECIVFNLNKNSPIFIWTTENFKDYEKLYTFIKNEFKTYKTLFLISKLEFYNFINNANVIDFHEMGVFRCDNLADVEYNGIPSSIDENEIKTVAKIYKDFMQEARDEIVSDEACLVEAKNYINNENYKVWKNAYGDITSIACVYSVDKYSRIAGVFTTPDERGKSYAKMITHHLTKQIQSKKQIPILFSYADNLSSTECYKKLGYTQITKTAYYKIMKDGQCSN